MKFMEEHKKTLTYLSFLNVRKKRLTVKEGGKVHKALKQTTRCQRLTANFWEANALDCGHLPALLNLSCRCGTRMPKWIKGFYYEKVDYLSDL